jgi:phosphoribosylformylglycinamidine synthase
VLRIGVTDAESPVVEVQGLFTVPLEELRAVNGAVLPSRFA